MIFVLWRSTGDGGNSNVVRRNLKLSRVYIRFTIDFLLCIVSFILEKLFDNIRMIKYNQPMLNMSTQSLILL